MSETVNSPVLINDDNNLATINNTVQVASNVSKIATQAISFTKKTWIDNATSGTPITAADMNRLEQAIVDLNTNIQSLQDSVSRKLDDIGVAAVGTQPAADWIFATAIRCPTGVVIGGNVTGNLIAQGSTILTVNLWKEAAPVNLVMRGFFHGHQSAAMIAVSGSTLTVTMEQQTSFSSGDTFGALVPLTWA